MTEESIEENDDFKPHFMYKGTKKVKVEDIETHLKLKAEGYTHKEKKPSITDLYKAGYNKKKKSLDNTTPDKTKKNVEDIELWGDEDTFMLIFKSSSEQEGWMKSTKAMQCGDNVVIQVTTQQKNGNGSYSLAEALTTVEEAEIVTVYLDEDKEEQEVLDNEVPEKFEAIRRYIREKS
jgi:hypothetical protein